MLYFPLILTSIALTKIRISSPKLYGTLLVIYSMMGLLFIKNTNVNSYSYASSVMAYYSMMDTIKKDHSSPEIVYLGDNAVLQDWINGTRIIMNKKGINKELYFATIAPSIPYWQKSYASMSPQNAFRHMSLDSVFSPNGKWIILVENPSKNGIVNDNIIFYKRADSSFVKLNGIEKYIFGNYHYFSSPYPARGLKDLFTGNFNAINRLGFYAIKLYDKP